MSKTSRAGRKPRRGTPMPSTTFTATTEEMAFLMQLGDGSVVTGVQRAVAVLAKTDDYATLQEKARQLVAEVERRLKPDENGLVPQRESYKYLSGNYWELLEAIGA